MIESFCHLSFGLTDNILAHVIFPSGVLVLSIVSTLSMQNNGKFCELIGIISFWIYLHYDLYSNDRIFIYSLSNTRNIFTQCRSNTYSNYSVNTSFNSKAFSMHYIFILIFKVVHSFNAIIRCTYVLGIIYVIENH